MAGVEISTIELDGLTYRARLDDDGRRRLQHLLEEIDRARESGVSATEVLQALTAERRGEK